MDRTKEKWLSIIVPIYNAEKYLAECVDSMLEQDIDKDLYEIILYDDGSKDGSLQIAKDYARRYSNIRVFTHPNAGVSVTRNAGLDEAVGEYVWFVDNDDMIFKNVLSVLHDYTEQTKVDILIFDAVRFNETMQWKLAPFAVKETEVQNGKKAFVGFYYEPVPWNKLLKRSLLKGNNIYFLAEQKLSEDGEWACRCFYHADRVKAIAVDAVKWRITSGSFSHTKNNVRLMLEGGMLPCLERNYEYMLTHPCSWYWMRVFVLGIRRIHRQCDDTSNPNFKEALTRDEIRKYYGRERDICRRIVAHLPFSLRLDYWILLCCAISPSLIVAVQRNLRRIRHLKNKKI